MKTNQKVPEGWSVKKLGDVCYLIAGNAFDSNDFVQEGIPLIRISNIDEDKIVLNENTVFLKESFLKENEKFKVQYNDLLIAMSGATTGKMGINTFLEPMLLNQRVCIIRAKNISQNYLNQYLFTHKKDILKQSYGGAQPNIGNNDIKKIKLLLPPLCEQEQIAEILGTWDLAIEKLTALIEQKKLLKKGLMQRLLTGKQRLPGFSAPWKKVKLGECLSLLKDGTHGTHQNSPDGIMLLSAKDVINGNILLPSDSRRISQKDFNMLHKNYHLQNDDVALTIVGTIGRCAIIKNYSNNFTFQRSVAVLRPNKTIISKFLYILLQGKKIQNALFNRQSISAQPGIYLHDLSKISFNLPPLPEQKAIADILSKADEEIDLLTRKLSALKEQKTGLMQQLLTGKIRVKVA